jgi:hypothetical protein
MNSNFKEWPMPPKLDEERAQFVLAKIDHILDWERQTDRDGEHFICANWLHKAKEMPMQQFKDEVEKYLTGDSEPSELIYFKVYRSQVPVIEQALEIAARMLGSDKSRGYCLEMICADFLAGVSISWNPKTEDPSTGNSEAA